MSKPNGLITGMLLGAGALYLLDPERGGQRRAVVREQAGRLGRRLNEDVVPAVRDLASRTADRTQQLRSRWGTTAGEDELPETQGLGSPAGLWERSLSGRREWDPATRVALGGLGGLLALRGASRLGVLGPAVRAAGLGLLARAVTNRPASRLAGFRPDPASEEEQSRVPAAPLPTAESAAAPS